MKQWIVRRRPWVLVVLMMFAAAVVGGALDELTGTASRGTIGALLWIGGSIGVLVWRSRLRQGLDSAPGAPQIPPPAWVQPPTPPTGWEPRGPAPAITHQPATPPSINDRELSALMNLSDSPEGIAEKLQVLAPIEPLKEQIEASGETHHMREIKAVFAAAGRTIADRGSTLNDQVAVLVPEPTNDYDDNAVAVVIAGGVVGYLPRDMAAEYFPALHRLAGHGQLASGKARVWAKKQSTGAVWARVTVMMTPPGML